MKFYHGLLIGAIVSLLFLIDGCNKKAKLTEAITSINEYSDTVKNERTKSGRLLSYNSNLEVSQEALYLAVDSLKSYISDIGVKNPEVITIVKTDTKLDTIFIPLNIANCDFDTTFHIDSSHYNISGRITDEGLSLNNISFANEMGMVVGYKKEKWFKRKERVITVTNSNPYMDVKGLTSFTIVNKKKWYERPLIHFGLGVIAGGAFIHLTK